jgi:hypothetical protein
MMTCVCPAAAGVVLDAGAALELVAALDDVAELEDGLDVLLPLEQPATPAMTVNAPTAINNSRFTKFSLV